MQFNYKSHSNSLALRMNQSRVILSASLLIAAICATTTLTIAQIKQGKTRPAKTGQLMKGLVGPNSNALKKGLEMAPAKDDDWAKLGVNAASLNEVGYILMDDGRCPDEVWSNACKMMREEGEKLMKALEAKDFDTSKKAFGDLGKSCKACHEKHKKKA